ncbi:hypothetical protein MVLG_03498 [Microbotryum lychnidis-dioicae p1A1 Lamole]|uniref:DNA polymerase n=1 Tax=Microbotryum lychnidis-dioicae (strain p1A1 Lamole / MvSl-1064) TaxID=683840 RepID=U5H8D6_USTV1|nr:hypothetical protein MVLG_03498 [Microbotryum lychnidis-dioicae p1A1 Lamole]|eukprot:KDE06220.1 hypothetical protein MVLG_03498 [Microbotryum lychnidis-dioicae p1A1 Lamole]
MPKASTSRPLPQRKTRSYAYSDRPPLSRRHTSSSSSLLDQDDHPAGSTAITPVNILACFRKSPRPCVNQDLVDKLKPLREERFLLYGSAHPKAISYATAISVIIGTPWKIRTAEQARSLPKVGEKIVTKIEEYLRTGEIDDAIRAGNNSKALALKDMSAVHGVGHVMANSLYTKGLRSLQEMRDSKQWEKEFQWHDNIQQKMPRHEVESIHEFIKIQIEKVEPGATTLLCGGYRRGKELSNDVDILITYAENDGKERGVLATLVERLRVSYPTTAEWYYEEERSLEKGRLGRGEMAAVGGGGGGVDGNLKFDSGGIHSRLTGEVIRAATEEDVFKVLGVPYLPPELRNADP